jgi:Recombinase/Recombinase zinc beta ribbon domain
VRAAPCPSIVRREARKVEGAFRLRAAGEPFSEIGRRFGWSHSTTRQILANEVYLGVIRHGGFRRENAHDAIVSRELFDSANAARTVQAVPPGDTTNDRLLTGLARCQGCDKTLKTVRRRRADGSHVVSYYCKNAASEPCPERAYVHADELDAFVEEWFTEAIGTVPRVVDVVAVGVELDQAQAALAKAQEQLRRYVDKVDIEDAAVWQHGRTPASAAWPKPGNEWGNYLPAFRVFPPAGRSGRTGTASMRSSAARCSPPRSTASTFAGAPARISRAASRSSGATGRSPSPMSRTMKRASG